jgi:hypothetical protein
VTDAGCHNVKDIAINRVTDLASELDRNTRDAAHADEVIE